MNQICEFKAYSFEKNYTYSHSLANKSNLKKLDLSQALPSWLTAHLQKIDNLFLYSSYSLKQVQIWSQEYASLRGSSANLKEWQRRIIEKNARTQEVLI